MENLMECMCLECGISIYLDLGKIAVEEVPDSKMKVLRDTFCPECGGTLSLRGRAGDEPCYRLA
jgi:hypothetical protein